ncbi:MAG TPA: hypothetical protein VLI92_04865, partial [Candidatus Saccharimonadales bacterium]|nr:hypothetical protein [Candidatus Saccharimonadales bacterium]
QEDKSFYINMLVDFQLSQSGRTKERWYKDLIKRMLENDTFRELWSNLNTYNSEKYQIDGFAIKSMHGLKFYFFVLPVITDPRFFVEYYVPADVKTFKYYQK